MSIQRKFTVPKDGEAYIDSVLERCQKFIETSIWQGIEKYDIDRWLHNFSGNEERYFASIVLDSLIYRSNDQTESLIKQLFQRTLPNLELKNDLDSEWLYPLSTNSKAPIRLVPVIKDTDPPTKSGTLILRFMKRRYRIKEDLMIWPWQLKDCLTNNKNIHTIIFIDDFLGSGTQFKCFFDRMISNQAQNNDIQYIYPPLMAFEDGVTNIKKMFPRLICSPVEMLSTEHQLFSEKSLSFGQHGNEENTHDVACAFYKKMVENKGFPENYIFGYGNLGLITAFEHAVPNCSLPILWCKTENWNPLFNR